ncbi:Na+/H+ antiporter NhaA [Aestuariibacter sp. AA17]|uniref:Na(+)/H(+) antiporter NhaA n=1 Tax=Fluctibacter corallii TaxID=2984329 RepID=A0ABT3A991_9ALTE|nr:Na+/H+ antiporter NhaA [Aestuariibacter sp. AA17]MCV2885152.1 Na+/H+ antiporter NhaA [Aestuariibacter sp. AA17]
MQSDFRGDLRERAPLEKGFLRVTTPFEAFFNSQTSAGLVLVIAAIIALLLANSDFYPIYAELNKAPLSVSLGSFEFSHSLHYWVNDGLMAFFFFLLGLEIKYEVLVGDLSDAKDASLVIAMALGGMIFPAAMYVCVLSFLGADAWRGWGIPMATDTAFALGILALLGSKAPRSVAVALSALAIVDDMGAVAVIGLFYTENIELSMLFNAAIVFGILVAMNLVGIRRPIFYFFVGVVLWWCILQSGVHATTAGILTALTVPTKPYLGTQWFSRQMRALLKRFDRIDQPGQSIVEDREQHHIAEQAERLARRTTSPVLKWSHTLDRPVAMFILPLFAFLNAGVIIPNELNIGADSAVLVAVCFGLVFGKVMGITLFAWASMKMGFSRLPSDMTFAHVVGLGCLAGIGFTMSLFIAALAFADMPELQAQAKLGILAGSLMSGIFGVAVFIVTSSTHNKKEPIHGR